jgi:hypothetical protein
MIRACAALGVASLAVQSAAMGEGRLKAAGKHDEKGGENRRPHERHSVHPDEYAYNFRVKS